MFGLTSKGWAKQAPKTRKARRTMKAKCGKKCFLSESSFPICAKGTCKINPKGIYAAYVRAREFGSAKKTPNKKHTKKQYKTIASRAKKMLISRGFAKK